MSEDQTHPIEPEDPAPSPGAQPAYAMPVPAGYPAYAVPQRPRFADQVMGMRAVVATSLACLIVGGLGGFVLGHATGDDRHGFGGPPAGFMPRGGGFPHAPGAPQQQFGQGQSHGQNQGQSQSQN
jgi:hypothetical protein